MSLNKLDRNELLFTVFDACRCGYYDFIKHIFDENPSDINIQNSLGQNCLMICCEFNSIEIFKYLISKKHINYLLSDYYENWNCLHYACMYGNFRIAQMLLNKTSPISYPKYQNDANGYNPFDLLPSNIYKKQLYDDIYSQSNKQIQRKIYNSSYTRILQKGWCQRVYGSEDNEIISNLQVQGVLYAWGSNINDQLGLNNNNTYRSTPKIIKHLRNISIIDISCSGYHSICISDNGNVYVWGNNIDGRCGLGYCNNEYKPYIKKPMLLKLKGNNNNNNNKDEIFTACTATRDHSTLLSNAGDVYVFGCDKNKSYLLDNKGPKLNHGKYNVKNVKTKGMKFIWSDKLEPFCISNNNKSGIRYISSSVQRTVMIGNDNKLYIIGKSFCNTKINYPTLINTSNRNLKKSGVQYACVGHNWLVLLLMNGVLFSMNKNKDNSNEMHFSEIRLNKEFRFRHHHNKREAVKIQYITCYNMDNHGRCIALATNNDIYEWKAPSTNAYYIGNVSGITDISCGPKICIMTNNMGECYAFGDQQILGLSEKDKKLLKSNQKNKKLTDNKRFQKKGYKRANIQRIMSLSQIAKVYAFKNSVFVIQSFLWPNRNLLNANQYHKQLKQLKNKQIEKSFWNYDTTQQNNKPNQNLYDTYNMFSVLSVNDMKHSDDTIARPKKHKKKNKRKKSHKKKHCKMKQKNKQEIILPLMSDHEYDMKDEKEDEKDIIRGLDEEDMHMTSKVPCLVSYCEDILIQQIDIQTVISLYKQSYKMCFYRISVFLSFVIIENISHLLYFLLRDCLEDEIMFIEQLWKTKYYPHVNISWKRYYGNTQWLKHKKTIIEQYRIVPKYYPNYKTELYNVNDMLHKVCVIEEKVKKLMNKFEMKDEDEDEENKNTLLDKALQVLTVKDRNIYESKLQLLGERNRILFKIGNPEEFPSLQMMDKWKRRQKKKNNYNTFDDKDKNNKNKKFKHDKHLIGIGISDRFDADKYLKHVYLKNTCKTNIKKLEKKIGLSFSFDYDLYKKKYSNGIIYRTFNVKNAIEKDLKKAKKMHKKQDKKLKQIGHKKSQKQKQNNNKSQKQTQNISQTNTKQNHKKRRKRKRNQNQAQKQQLSPKTVPVTQLQNKNKNKINSPKATVNNNSPKTISPIDVVRRNREKKLLEQQLSSLKNDVWDLSEIEQKNNSDNKLIFSSGSLSNILSTQKVQYENEQKKKRDEKFVKYQETQNAWIIQQENVKDKKIKGIRPNVNSKHDIVQKKKVVSVSEAQKEEMRLRCLAQHEYEWMVGGLKNVNDKNDDYDAFVKQQQLLLKSFEESSTGSGNMNMNMNMNDDNRNRGYAYNDGNRRYRSDNRYNNDDYRGGYMGGRGGRYNDRYNYRGRGRGSADYRGRGRGRGGRGGRGRGGRYYNDNRQYNENGDKWRRK